MFTQIPKVILAIEDSSSYCRDLIKGISRYARVHGPWSIYRDIHDSSYLHGRNYRKEFYEHLQDIEADGLITRSPKRTMKLTRKGIPTIVAITESKAVGDFPKLQINHIAVGEMAAKYFLEKGYKNFAFYGDTKYLWTKMRYKGFRNIVEKSRCSLTCYDPPPAKTIMQKGFGYKINHIADWLSSLEKPIAVMASSDAWAVNVIEAARIAGINIPEQLSLIGVDNDVPICDTCFPQLSSIHLNSEQAGFKIAELLDRIMKGEKTYEHIVKVEPVQVITRVSTDTLAVEDEDVVTAMRYIRAMKREPVQITEVAEEAAVSLRTLQKKFKENLNSTILDEIKRTRINYIKELLLNTDMSITKVSDFLYFSGTNSFSRYFKANTGYSPLEYRKKYGRY
ncbi:Xylose operon regulatory protein [Limihaloglobus sulfuriphilus]|uniref:Xylose operon regulatory protein n=1 Tax=Limihaloglobus sulfuriphilus TaxID=1851148 RepID=A0A1Q2MGP6_9BACT|nr:XylR family transcriptional regulator [Limihaloglobus sulfuriphilus]AQQ71861.1 Xylose operon regulatory protein [Limihaloglobus sulfuriphilus]